MLARDSEPGAPHPGHVVVPEPNRRLATDLTTVWTRRDGVVAPRRRGSAGSEGVELANVLISRGHYSRPFSYDLEGESAERTVGYTNVAYSAGAKMLRLRSGSGLSASTRARVRGIVAAARTR